METKWIDARFEEIEKRIQIIEVALEKDIEESLLNKGLIEKKQYTKNKDGEDEERKKSIRAKTIEE